MSSTTHRPACLSEEAAQHWALVVKRGGATRLPAAPGHHVRQDLDPAPGAGRRRHEEPWPDGLYRELRGLAGRLGVDPEAVVLAAHAHVLTSLTGESTVLVGLPDPQGHLWPMRIDTGARSWAGLVRTAHRVLSACRRGLPDTPGPSAPRVGAAVLADVAARAGRPVPVVETAVGVLADPDRSDGVLTVVATARGLVLWHRTDRVDPAYAARLAGRHLHALCRLVAGPDDPPV